MMGNRSLGDYFKTESITRSIEFLTKYAGVPLERLWATIFAGDETAKIPFDQVSMDTLEKVGVTHIKQMSFDENRESDNFRRPGPVGPCGPCCEIYYDRGDDYGPADWDMGVNDRYTEIWNNVFMSYYDDGSCNLVELPAKNVDTGMGFERLMMVVQDVDTIYETDVFAPCLRILEKISPHPYPGFLKKTFESDVVEQTITKSYRIAVDHLRAASMLLFENLTPSNEWRGYVLRRIIRRMRYHINKLSPQWKKITSRDDIDLILSEMITELFFAVWWVGQLYVSTITKWLVQEMKQFESTVNKGEALLQQYFQTPGKTELTGEEVFKMYDTYGIPMELTKEVAAGVGMGIDEEGYHHHLEQAKQKSRDGSKKMFDKGIDWSLVVEWMPQTKFFGYDSLELTNIQLLKDIEVKGRRVLIFDQTPMYAEWGGQIADRGVLVLDSGEEIEIVDVQKYAGVYLHFVG